MMSLFSCYRNCHYRRKSLKALKIKLVGFWDGGNENNIITKILSQHYNIIHSDEPDWVICSVFPEYYSYTEYDCPRVMYCNESSIPDFGIVDYAISYYKLHFEDRYFRYPGCMQSYQFSENGEIIEIKKDYINHDDKSILKGKDIFCNYIYSNISENNIRESFFEQLSNKYKTVASAGRHLNNMPDGKNLPPGGKIEFQKRCKFSIAFENTRISGYCTEKIREAFIANTIPIYYGDPYVKEIFNPDAFIDVSDYKDYDEVIDVIRRLDNDDKAYMKMLSAPMYVDENIIQNKYNELREFLFRIFDQDPADAIRRSNYAYAKEHNDRMLYFYTINKGGKSKFILDLAYANQTGGGKEVMRCIKRKVINKTKKLLPFCNLL